MQVVKYQEISKNLGRREKYLLLAEGLDTCVYTPIYVPVTKNACFWSTRKTVEDSEKFPRIDDHKLYSSHSENYQHFQDKAHGTSKLPWTTFIIMKTFSKFSRFNSIKKMCPSRSTKKLRAKFLKSFSKELRNVLDHAWEKTS